MASKKTRGVADVPTQRLNIRLTVEAMKRLGVHALMSGRKPGEIVSGLICDHLREWALPANNSQRATKGISANLEAPDESSGIVAA